MTFEEFRELALHPPQYKGGTICRMDVYAYTDKWFDHEGGELFKAHTSYYDSWANANGSLSRIYDDVCQEGWKIYCSIIYEIPTGIDMRFEKYTSVMVYDENCNLIDRTLCAYPCGINDEKYETFRGRDEGLIQFKPGDIVEVMNLWAESEPTIDTAIITKTPLTIEESWKLYEKLGESYVDGMESDHYCYLIGDHWLAGYNSDAPSFLIFKPHRPISEKRKNELLGYYKNFTGHAYWRQGGSRLDKIAQATGGLSPDLAPGLKNLSPDDFDPIYNASRVEHIRETIDFNRERSLEYFLTKIEKHIQGVLSEFTDFIICITNTNWTGKRLYPNHAAQWEKAIAEKLPNAKSIKWGHRTAQGAMYYQIDIVAYK